MDHEQESSLVPQPPAEAENMANPFAAPQAVMEPIHAEGPTDYSQLPALRKNDVCSVIILVHIGAMLGGGLVPLGRLLSIVTTFGVIAVCVSVLSGNVYYNKKNPDGTLKPWSKSNKVAAVILLLLLVGGNIAILYFLYAVVTR